jgi:hypothetical protein
VDSQTETVLISEDEMNREDMADKIYDILEGRWEKEFEEDYSKWKDFLSKHGIEFRDYNVDQAYSMFDDMMYLLNERKDAVFLKDPQREGVGHESADWLVMLVVPKKLAEQILVLGDLP